MTWDEMKFRANVGEYVIDGLGEVRHMISVNDANRILSEKLKMAPEVFGEARANNTVFVNFASLFPSESDTHKARLICIEEIK